MPFPPVGFGPVAPDCPYWRLRPYPNVRISAVTEPSLLVVCAAAFIAVLALLSVLAGMIRALTALFPPAENTDSAVVAAITAAATRAYPGMAVKRIQENR